MKYLKLLLIVPILFLSFSSCEQLEDLGLSNADIVAGLKQALEFGANDAVDLTNITDGFNANALKPDIRILLPADAQKIYDALNNPVVATLLSAVSGSDVDNLTVLLNRAAEEAAVKAKPILVDAITGMTVTDGLGILKGADNAATSYLNTSTNSSIQTAFKPDIQTALTAVGAQQAWETITTQYNNAAATGAGTLAGLNPVTTDLAEHTTTKAIDGLFGLVEIKEKKIRDDVGARTTDLLQKVFAEQD